MDKETVDTIRQMKIIQQCGVDAWTRPIFVVAAANLPDPKLFSYDLLLKYMVEQLSLIVESDYVIVLFYHGMVHKPTWGWLKQAYGMLERKFKKNLKNMYIVHASTWHKIIMNLLKLIISSKFLKKIVYIDSLADLGKHLPLKNLYIPAVVKSYDSSLSSNSGTFYVKRNATNLQMGAPLSKLMADGKMPLVFVESVDFLQKEGLTVVGLFRRSPAKTQLESVIQDYNQGNKVDLSEYDIHLTAVLLKKFFRELPETLIPSSLQNEIEEIKNCHNKETQLTITKDLIQKLPENNRIILAHLMRLLYNVSQNASENLMTAQNLAIVFGPNLLPEETTFDMGTSNVVIEIMISNYHPLFEEIVVAHEASLNSAEQSTSNSNSNEPNLEEVNLNGANSSEVEGKGKEPTEGSGLERKQSTRSEKRRGLLLNRNSRNSQF